MAPSVVFCGPFLVMMERAATKSFGGLFWDINGSVGTDLLSQGSTMNKECHGAGQDAGPWDGEFYHVADTGRSG